MVNILNALGAMSPEELAEAVARGGATGGAAAEPESQGVLDSILGALNSGARFMFDMDRSDSDWDIVSPRTQRLFSGGDDAAPEIDGPVGWERNALPPLEAPEEPRITYPFPMMGDTVARAQQSAVQELAGLEADYEEKLASLQDMYQLAETPAEKAMLQFELENLEAQRDAGHEVISNAYGSAIRGSNRQVKRARKDAVREGNRAERRFENAADNAASMVKRGEARFADSGYGIGDGGVRGPAAGTVRDIARQAAVEGNAAEGMGMAAADEMAFLGGAMRNERAAQQAEMQRLAAALSAQAQMTHAQQVNDRISQERAALLGAQFDLSNQYQQRAWGLEDQQSSFQMQSDQQAADAYNLWAEKQFEIDAAQQAREYETRFDEYLRERQMRQAGMLNDLDDEAYDSLLEQMERGVGFGMDPSTFLPQPR